MSRFIFGSFELNLNQCELSKAGTKIDMEPQVYCLLELLVIRHGEIVSRDEIIEKIWDGRIVSAGTIDSRIKAVRAALGDNGRDQRMIKTYPNRGYKFICELEEIGVQDDIAGRNDAHNRPSTRVWSALLRPFSSKGEFNFARFGIYSASILLIAGVGYTIGPGNTSSDTEDRQSEVTSITDESGLVVAPATQSTIALLPLQVVRSNETESYLANILDQELRQAITAIRGISVVSIPAEATIPDGLQDTRKLTSQLDLDYFVKATLLFQGEQVHLDVELVRVSDQVILWSGRHTRKPDVTEKELSSWPSNSAVSTTIEMANALGLSMNDRAAYLVSYEFQEKVAQARLLIAKDEYEDLSLAITLLEQAIEKEPKYLPAYETLYFAYWRRLSFVGDDLENDAKEMLDLTAVMEWISPDAPETIVVKASTSLLNAQGALKSGSGDGLSQVWEQLINQAITKDPQNTVARTMRSYFIMYEGQHSYEKIVAAHEDALRYSPTDAAVLGEYSRAKLCNGDIDDALRLAETNISWNPDSRKALNSVAMIAYARADYQTALQTMDLIIQKGWMQHDQTKTLRSIYFDFGISERAIPHVRFAPAKAQVLAMAGMRSRALTEAGKIPSYYTSQNAMLIADPTAVLEDYSVYPHYLEVIDTIDGFEANSCSLVYLANDAYAVRSLDSERSSILIGLLAKYFAGRDAPSLKTATEYIGLMSLHILRDEPNAALKVMDVAMEKGYVFIDRFKDPALRKLTSKPGFSRRFERMQARADAILREFEESSTN